MRVKICCIASIEEARIAIDAGAAALGLVSAMPSGPGPIDEALIAEIVAAVPPPTETFLLTSQQRAEAIVRQHRRCGTSVLQLVDAVADEDFKQLRAELPDIKLVQVIHVTGPASVDEALAAAPLVDALLLDSGNPRLAIKQLGGTGRTHDWAHSRAIVDQSPVPVWLAGGLNAGNVGAAIDAVRPHGLDLCSSVRSDGRLDARKLAAFMAMVRSSAQ